MNFFILFGSLGALFLLLFFWLYRRHSNLLNTKQILKSQLENISFICSDLHKEISIRNTALGEKEQILRNEISRRSALEERAQRMPNLEASLERQRQEIASLTIQNTELHSALEHERIQSSEKIKMLTQAQIALNDSFKALSAQALSANNESFLTLAKTTLERFQESAKVDLTQRQQAITDVLTPIQKALTQVDGKIESLEKERIGAYQVLRQQVSDLLLSQKELRSETSNLVKALRSPSIRGQWGEMQLKRVVEMSGMLSHCDFIEQLTTDDGKLRPDMIINLPGNKKIIVDAKTPLSAYLESFEATDEPTRLQKLDDHARQVRTHIRNLSQRAYWDQFEETPEFVVMFLPAESFFSTALERDPSLIEVGVKEKVILATPTTLIALLRAVAFGWRQESIADSARAVSEIGKEVYKRLSDMGKHMSSMGRQLGQVVESYNSTVGTFERRVLVSARKFKDLDIIAGDVTLDIINPIDTTPRNLQAFELINNENNDSISMLDSQSGSEEKLLIETV